MRKKAVFTLIAGALAVVALTAVLLVGLQSDGFGISALWRESRGEGRSASGYRYEYTWDPEEKPVSALDVEWINGAVEIVPGEDERIHITERSDGRELSADEKLKLSRSGSTLKIQWNNRFLRFSIFENTRKDLRIELPASLAGGLSRLKCANTSGNLLLTGFAENGGLHAEETELSTVSGRVFLAGLRGNSASVSGVSGNLALSGAVLSEVLRLNTTSGDIDLRDVSAGELSLNTVSGAATLDLSPEDEVASIDAQSVSGNLLLRLAGRCTLAELSTVSGELTAAVPSEQGFEVDYSTVSGVFSSDFELKGGQAKSDRLLYGDGELKLRMNSTGGGLAVRRLENLPEEEP